MYSVPSSLNEGSKDNVDQLGSLPGQRRSVLDGLKFKQDHRARLPPIISRFVGYRPPDTQPPYDPVPMAPFTWLHKIPLKYEVWLFGFVGALGSVLSIEAIMATGTVFRNDYGAPIIVTSFGASAVLLFTAIESPLSQPRNFLLGHFISALVGTCITRLFVLNHGYQGDLDNTNFHGNTFLNGGLSMAFSILAQDMLGAVHPPAGATGLNAAVEPGIVKLSWRYLPVVIVSALVMLGWALLVNNLGRRRYPLYWWEPESRLVLEETEIGSALPSDEKAILRAMEDGELRHAGAGSVSVESLQAEYLQATAPQRPQNIHLCRSSGELDVIEAIILELHRRNLTPGARSYMPG